EIPKDNVSEGKKSLEVAAAVGVFGRGTDCRFDGIGIAVDE
ncbi:12838_t:CDS:1, partial [Acaulospora colombiana]